MLLSQKKKVNILNIFPMVSSSIIAHRANIFDYVAGLFMKNLGNMEMWRIKSCAMNALKSLNLVFATAFTKLEGQICKLLNFYRLVKWKVLRWTFSNQS